MAKAWMGGLLMAAALAAPRTALAGPETPADRLGSGSRGVKEIN